MSTTNAYLNWGRWVADCPTPGCGNAVAFMFTKTLPDGSPAPDAPTLPAEFHCSSRYGCGQIGAIAWPDEFDTVNNEHGIGWKGETFQATDTPDAPWMIEYSFKGDTESPDQSWRPE